MTTPDAIALLRSKVAEYGVGGKSRAARELGYSPTVVTQILNEPPTYTGNIDNVARQIIVIYGGLTVICPVLGEISLSRCAEERKRPYAATNLQRVQLFQACQDCERGTK